MSPQPSLPPLRGAPARVFVSLDESTSRSTLSFAPAEVGAPVSYDDDPGATQAMATARAIVGANPGCALVGPHVHASARGRPRLRRGRR